MSQSDYESDEDDEENFENKIDTERLQSVKRILFNAHRVNTGEDYLEIPQFIDTLIHITSSKPAGKTFGEILLS